MQLSNGGLLENKVTKFFSGISIEIYLSHMLVFRVVEKLDIHKVFGNGWIQYIFTVINVVAGATVFAVVMQMVIKKAIEIVSMKERKI